MMRQTGRIPSAYLSTLATLEKALLALEPTSRIVPTTRTRITASITAYSAMSSALSSAQSLRSSNVIDGAYFKHIVEVMVSFLCSSYRSLTTRWAQGCRPRSRQQVASKRKIRTWFPRWQPRSVRLAVRAHSADSVFVTVVHFQVVGHLRAAFAVTQHGRV